MLAPNKLVPEIRASVPEILDACKQKFAEVYKVEAHMQGPMRAADMFAYVQAPLSSETLQKRLQN